MFLLTIDWFGFLMFIAINVSIVIVCYYVVRIAFQELTNFFKWLRGRE